MVVVLISIIITYTIASLFGYVIHWSLHQPWAGKFNSSHMAHHLKLYPPIDFTSEIYRKAGADSTTKFFAIASLPLIITPIVLCFVGFIPVLCLIAILLTEAIVGFLSDYLHDSFHIKNHWMTCLPVVQVIFERWIHLHYLHHVDMSKNYGIFSFHWDRLFKTFWTSNDVSRI